MTTTVTAEELVSLDEAAVILGFTKLYTRLLVRRGKLKTVKVPIGPSSQVWKHMLPRSDVEEFGKGTREGRSARADSRFKYTLYASPAELERVKELLVKDHLEEVANLIVRPNSPSAYKRRKQKAAAKMVNDASNR